MSRPSIRVRIDFCRFAILIYAEGLAIAPSRGTRVVKGAGMRSQCVVLRRVESCPLRHYSHHGEFDTDACPP